MEEKDVGLVSQVLRSALEKWQVPKIKQVSDIKDIQSATLQPYECRLCWVCKSEHIWSIKLQEAFQITPAIHLYSQTCLAEVAESSNLKSENDGHFLLKWSLFLWLHKSTKITGSIKARQVCGDSDGTWVHTRGISWCICHPNLSKILHNTTLTLPGCGSSWDCYCSRLGKTSLLSVELPESSAFNKATLWKQGLRLHYEEYLNTSTKPSAQDPVN